MSVNVIVIEPGKEPEVRAVEPKLATWQGLVGGLVDRAIVLNAPEALPHNDVDLLCNDEGLLIGQEPNRWRLTDGSPLVGPLVAVKVTNDPEGGDWTGFKADEIPKVLEAINAWTKKIEVWTGTPVEKCDLCSEPVGGNLATGSY